MPIDSRSIFFLPPPKIEEKRPESFSFFESPPDVFRLLSFFRSSSSLTSPRSRTTLSRPRPPSIVVCSKSSRVLSSDLSRGLPSFDLPFFDKSSSFLFSFSFSSLPSNEPQLQLDFLTPSLPSFSFLSLPFLTSGFFSSVNVGMNERLSVLVLLPGSGDG